MTGEPTLRHGDHEADGWVKYLQEQLAYRLHDSSLEHTGTFDDQTLHAVKTFQSGNGLHPDGIVGDATWAALTNDAPAHEGTDGLKAHTHIDHGMHVVWTEHGGSDDGVYIESSDTVMWVASNVGDTNVPSDNLNACINFPDKNYLEFIEMIESGGASEAAPGGLFVVTMTGVKAALGSGTHGYVAELPDEVGKAQRHGEITVP
jgi:hypothetical protein